MRKICKFLTLPTSLFDTPDLSLSAKWCLLAIDSITPQGGYVSIGIQGLSSLTNLPSKAVKEALSELHEHGAIEVRLSEDGQKVMKPLLYKDAYPKIGEKPIIGDKPTDSDPIDYAYIQDKWNEICHDLPKLERMTPSRKSRVRSVLKQSDLSVEDFIKCFKIIACTPFLSGKSDQFKATFDWVASSSKNVTKVWEGFYARSFQEKRDHELIRNGGEVSQKQDETEFYR